MSTQPSPPRVRRPLPALALAWVLVLAAPRPTHPEPAPVAAPTASLAALVASLDASDDNTLSLKENASLRLAVSPCAVRLPVDKNARHPLHGPVAVRREVRLGSLERPLRLVALAAAEPETRAVPAALPARMPASSPASVVKIPSQQTSALAASGDQKAAPATPATSPLPGKRILVAGDSLSLFLADALRPMLAGRPQTAFASRGKVSSGLARPDFFDWEREMTALVAANHPDTVIVMIATNDNQTMTRPDGVKVAFGRPSWNEEYARRVRRLTELARSANPAARVFWLGAPVMADPRLNADVAAINAVIARELAAIQGCRFIDVSRTLADAAGRYAQSLATPDGPRAARTRDGVHLTPYGARLLAGATLASLGPNLASLTRP